MRSIAWALLLLFAFTVPWENSLDLGAPFGNVARIAGLLLLLAVVPAILEKGRVRMPGRVQWLVLALFLWFCCSYFWSIDATATLESIRAYAQVMMAVWIVWELTETPRDLRDLMIAYVAGSWVLAALTFANFASPNTANQVRFVAEGQDPNDMARFLNLGFPLAALLLRSEHRWWGRTLAWGYFPLGLASELLTGSRSGFLTASIAIFGSAFLIVRPQARALFGGLGTLLVTAFASWFIVPHATIARIATIPEQLLRGDLNQRLNIWAIGWQAFVHAPMVGSGAGSFVAASGLARIDTAHNTALALAVEGGLIALALALGILVAASRCVLQARGAVQLCLGTALVVGIVSSLVATVQGGRSTWLMLALIAAASRLTIESPTAMALQFEPGFRSDDTTRIAETVV